jgi:hypothetical protein
MKIRYALMSIAALTVAPTVSYAQTSGSDIPSRNISPSQPSDLRDPDATGTIAPRTPRGTNAPMADPMRAGEPRTSAPYTQGGPTPEVGHQ